MRGWFSRPAPAPERSATRAAVEERLSEQESRILTEFYRQYGLQFRNPDLLRLALTHRSYLSVTGQSARASNERLEFLGDSVLGLVTSEYLFRRHPDEHEGQLTKTKSLLVSKAILSRRALKMGLGRYVFLSHSEVESGGRQRLSILADAFESVLGAIYLDQGFEVARTFIHKHLLAESDAIVADKRHTNYKSHLQEYVQSTYRTHPVYRIRSEYGPDHSKHFMVEVLVGRRMLGSGRGQNKKEAEQAAARDAIERVQGGRSPRPGDEDVPDPSRPRRPRRDGEGDAAPRRSRRARPEREEHEDGPGPGTDVLAPRHEPPAREPEAADEALAETRRSPRDGVRRRRGRHRDEDVGSSRPGTGDHAPGSRDVEPMPEPMPEPEPEQDESDAPPAPARAVARVEPDVPPAAGEPRPDDDPVEPDEVSDARVDEIEQALASFGRRGSKYGRRGRRR